MHFNDFSKQLKVKNHLSGLLEIENHKLNFAKMFFLNKLTKFNKSSGTRQTGKSTHNALLALYNYIYKEESSLIVVFNTPDKQRLIKDLESFTRQLSLPDQVIYSHNYSHSHISILSLNAWRDQKKLLIKKHDHVFIDNEIVDQYHEFLNRQMRDSGVDFFIDLCTGFSNMIKLMQDKKELKSMNCLTLLNGKIAIVSDGTKFEPGDLFTITTNNKDATGIGTLININYDESINWASTIDILFDNNVVQMPAYNIEYFTKL
jgi:hypothetical protein